MTAAEDGLRGSEVGAGSKTAEERLLVEILGFKQQKSPLDERNKFNLAA